MFVKVCPGYCFPERDAFYLNTDAIVRVKEEPIPKKSNLQNEARFIVTVAGEHDYKLYYEHNKEFLAYFRDNRFTVKDPSQACTIKSKSPTEYGKTIEVGRVLCQKQ